MGTNINVVVWRIVGKDTNQRTDDPGHQRTDLLNRGAY
jgi:hypothetical protein